MKENFRPSKQFLIRGAIAFGALAIILMVQTDWFRSLFHKAPLTVDSTKTVGEFVAQDTNGNGIADWEEKLWGLDPTVLYTNGVSNKSIIEEKKRALGITEADNGAPQNETDSLARELLTISAALGQSGEITQDSLAAVGARLAESVEFQQESNHYSIKDFSTVQTSTATLTAYYATMGKLSSKYERGGSEIDVISAALESGDTSGLSQLDPIKKSYEAYAKELTALPIPVGVERMHLEIANSIYGAARAIGYMQELGDNGANALAGVALYKIYEAKLSLAVTDLESYLKRYGILQ